MGQDEQHRLQGVRVLVLKKLFQQEMLLLRDFLLTEKLFGESLSSAGCLWSASPHLPCPFRLEKIIASGDTCTPRKMDLYPRAAALVVSCEKCLEFPHQSFNWNAVF